MKTFVVFDQEGNQFVVQAASEQEALERVGKLAPSFEGWGMDELVAHEATPREEDAGVLWFYADL